MARSRNAELPTEEELRWSHPASKSLHQVFAEELWTDSSAITTPKAPDTPSGTETAFSSSATALDSQDTQRNLLWTMAEERSLAGWNAAILLAQRRPYHATNLLPSLWDLIREPQEYEVPSKQKDSNGNKTPPTLQKTGPKLRAAAAEAYTLVLSVHPTEEFETDRERLKHLLQRDDLPDPVRVELLLGGGKCLKPNEIPEILDVLGLREAAASEKPNPAAKELRRAALQACLLYAMQARAREVAPDAIAQALPLNLSNLQQDTDPGLRSDLGRLLGVSRHPHAWSVLKEQLRDVEPTVRNEACESLGWLGSEDARGELRKLRSSEHELLRVAANRGLAHFGVEELRPALQDKSPLVRQEAARHLGSFHSPETASLLRSCLNDPNPQVQQEAVRQVTGWPERLAVPLLIAALEEGQVEVRRTALMNLERRAGHALRFSINGTPEERLRESAALRQIWSQPGTAATPSDAPPLSDSHRTRDLRQAELRSEVQAYLAYAPGDTRNAEALERLSRLSPADLPWLESLLPTLSAEQSQKLLHDLLPRVSPQYQGFELLEQSDVQRRRQGAEQILQAASKSSLSPYSLKRMRDVLAREQDALVWRFCMLALTDDPSTEAAQIAQLAVHHPWPDVRLLGCEYVARHGVADQAHWIRHLFADQNVAVRTAAIRAAVRCRNPIVILDTPDGQPGLRRLLTTAAPEERVFIACCLAQFGDDQGTQEFLRLSQHPDWRIRYQVVTGMGDSGQARFVENLIRIAWTEKHPSVRQATCAALEKLVPPSQQPSGLKTARNEDQKIAVWGEWWGSHPAQRPSPQNQHAATDSQ